MDRKPPPSSRAGTRRRPTGAATRDEEALALVRRYAPRLETWLRRKGVSDDDRGDILQEIQIAAAKRADQLLAAAKPEAWLRRVAHRRYADLCQQVAKRGRQEPLDGLDLPRLSRTVSSKLGWKEVFTRCSAELPNDDCRAIFRFWHRDGLQPHEIARALNEQGSRNTAGGIYTPTIVQQRLRRDIVPRLKSLLAEGR